MNDAGQTLTPLQTAIGSVVCGVIAGAFAYLETRVIVLAAVAALIVAVALARWLPRQQINARGSTPGRTLPRVSVATTGLLLVIGVALAVWLSDWVIAAVTAGAAASWLALALRSHRR